MARWPPPTPVPRSRALRLLLLLPASSRSQPGVRRGRPRLPLSGSNTLSSSSPRRSSGWSSPWRSDRPEAGHRFVLFSGPESFSSTPPSRPSADPQLADRLRCAAEVLSHEGARFSRFGGLDPDHAAQGPHSDHPCCMCSSVLPAPPGRSTRCSAGRGCRILAPAKGAHGSFKLRPRGRRGAPRRRLLRGSGGSDGRLGLE